MTERTPFWWADNVERLPPSYESNELVRAVAHATVTEQLRRGDFDLFNRLEFGHAFAEAMGDLGLNSWECVAEPVLSPNGRMTGLRICPVNGYDDDHNPVDFRSDVVLVLDNEGRVLDDHGLANYFNLAI